MREKGEEDQGEGHVRWEDEVPFFRRGSINQLNLSGQF
jgi:hypothetical protein